MAPVVDRLSGELSAKVRLPLARWLVAAREPVKAETYLDQVLEQDPANVPALLLLAEVQKASGRESGAATSLLRVLAVDPANREAAEKLQALRAERRQVEEAGGAASSSSRRFLWPLILVLVNMRVCRAPDWASDLDATAVVALLLFVAVLVALGIILRRTEGTIVRVLGVSVALLVLGVLVWQALHGRSVRPDPARSEAARSPTDVSIVSLGPERLPLRWGDSITLKVVARYSLPPEGGGIVRLFAGAPPAAPSLQVDVKDVPGGAGEVVLQGPFVVPAARRVDITVSLHPRKGRPTLLVATGYLAAERR